MFIFSFKGYVFLLHFQTATEKYTTSFENEKKTTDN